MMNEVQKQEVEEETFVYEVDEETSAPEQKSEIPKVESSEEERTIVREKVEKTEEPEELEAYSDNVQKRINQLTAKRKQALEEADAAFNFAQQQKNENDKLKQQLNQLNQGYTSEFSNRIESQSAQAKKLFKEAFDAGDSDKMAEANDLMSKLAIENERLRIQKARTEQATTTQSNAPTSNAQERQTQKVAPKQELDPKLQNWLDGNSWFGTDMVMTRGAQAIHEQLVSGEGFDPTTDDYYKEVSRRMSTEFPHKFKGVQRNAQSVTPASNGRSMKKGGKKTIELTPGQVNFAKKMRIPLEKYAQEVAKIERSKGVA